MAAVPATVSDPEFVSAVAECLAAESKNILTPAFYEISLQGKVLRDNESEDVLKIILDTMTGDVVDTWPSISGAIEKQKRLFVYSKPGSWNDPDMLMVGMNGLNDTQYRTHMATWCMMNSPLFLGLDLRRVEKGDALYQIIANKDLIDLNQDALGVQAKRVYSSLAVERPDKEYIRDINRVDILCKPLSGGDFALCFVNVSEEDKKGEFSVDVKELSKIFAGIKSEGRDDKGKSYDMFHGFHLFLIKT